MNQNSKLFCFWTGAEAMSPNRLRALDSLQNTNLDVVIVNENNLSSWIAEHAPIHHAFKYLSSVHKADYLRCYFMHNYGGAYCDIKFIQDSWLSAYQDLNNSNCYINGYREVNFLQTAKGRGLLKDIWLSLNFFRVIGNGAFICEPNTIFTEQWIRRVHEILDYKYELLKLNPANEARDFYNKLIHENLKSSYPLRWAELCGEIFHPLCLKHSNKILKTLPTPNFGINYL